MWWDLFGTEKLRKNIRPLPSIPGPVTPPIVRHWGQDCKHLGSGIQRGDVVPCPLRLPFVLEQATLVVGLYRFRQCFSTNDPEILESGTIGHPCL